MCPVFSVAEDLGEYRSNNQHLLRDYPEFAKWLDDEYFPIAGGWQY